MFQIKLIGIITLLTIGVANAQNTSFSLEDAKAFALENNFQAKNADYETKLAEQSVNATKSMIFPQISGEGSFQNFIDIPVQPAPADAFGFPDYLTQFLGGVSQATGVPINAPAPTGDGEFTEIQFGTKYNFSGGITANQLIFDGSYFYGLKASKAYSELMNITEQKTDEDIIEGVEKAYYMALIAQENVQILSKSQKNIEIILKQTQAFNKEGFVEDQDVDQLELNVATLTSSITNARLQEELAQKVLKFQMGYPIEQSIELTDKLSALLNEIPTNLLEKQSEVKNLSEYKILDYQERLLTLNKKATSSSIYPKLYGFFNHSQNLYLNEFDFSSSKWYPTTLWGLNLQVPIFSGFKFKAEIEKSNIELQRMSDLKIMTEEKLKLDVSTARTEYLSAKNDLNTNKKAMELAQKIENKTQIKFNEGLSSSLELTQAQNQFLTNQGNYINSLFRLMSAKTTLEKVSK